MRAHGLPDIGLLIPQAPRETRSLGEELDLLDDPARAVRVMRLLGNHATVRHPAASCDSHGFAADTSRTHEIADFGSGLTAWSPRAPSPSPEGFRSATREELHVIGSILIGTELIVGATVFGQAADEEGAAAARSDLAGSERKEVASEACRGDPAAVDSVLPTAGLSRPIFTRRRSASSRGRLLSSDGLRGRRRHFLLKAYRRQRLAAGDGIGERRAHVA